MRYRALFLLCLLWANPSWAAITEDAQSTCEGTTSVTCSHTFGGSANFAYICVGVRDSAGAVVVPTNVTVNGVAATSVGNMVNSLNVVAASVWRHNNPPVGTVNVTATGGAGTDFMLMAVRSYGGVDTSNPIGTPVNKATSTASTDMDVDAISSGSGQLGVLCGTARKGGANVTFVPDATVPVSTEYADFTHSSGSPQISLAVYEEAGANPSIDMRVDVSESVQSAAVGVSLIPAIVSSVRPRPLVVFP